MVSPGPKILYGAHVLGHLKNVMEAEAINRPLIVSGPNVWRTCGGDQLMACLPAHIKLSRYSDYSENPRMEDVDACIDLARDTDADAVIGIGGGTAMDLAKSTAVLSYQPGVAKDYVTGTRSLEKPRRLKLILAPTTSGSGSEMTSFAVIYVEACKYSLDDPMTQADWAIVDPSLTTSAPAMSL